MTQQLVTVEPLHITSRLPSFDIWILKFSLWTHYMRGHYSETKWVRWTSEMSPVDACNSLLYLPVFRSIGSAKIYWRTHKKYTARTNCCDYLTDTVFQGDHKSNSERQAAIPLMTRKTTIPSAATPTPIPVGEFHYGPTWIKKCCDGITYVVIDNCISYKQVISFGRIYISPLSLLLKSLSYNTLVF